MWDCEELFADEAEVFGFEVVRVSAGDDDVLYFGVRADVIEHSVPSLRSGFVRFLLERFDGCADGVGARAEAAVDWADGCGEEEHFVWVAMDEPFDDGVFCFV